MFVCARANHSQNDTHYGYESQNEGTTYILRNKILAKTNHVLPMYTCNRTNYITHISRHL